MLTVSVDVTNTGDVEGKETVQLYIHDVAAEVARPVKELKGFAQTELAPGETKTVTFELDEESFSYYNLELEKTTDPGRVEIMVGNSSRDCDLQMKEIMILP